MRFKIKFVLGVLICWLMLIGLSGQSQVTASWSDKVLAHNNSFASGEWQQDPDQDPQYIEKIINGDFDQDLAAWTAIGDVSLVDQTEHGVVPLASKMIRIGGEADLGWANSVNFLYQEINLDPESKAISFWFNFVTYEESYGFDEPGFMVLLDDEVVYQYWAGDLVQSGLTDGDVSSANQSGWRQIVLPSDYVGTARVTLAFYAGNTLDAQHQSFVYIDNISTSQELGIDQLPPEAIHDLSVQGLADKYLTVSWTAPADQGGNEENKVCWYELRYSDLPIEIGITSSDWAKLAQPIIYNSLGLPGGNLRAPRLPGQRETFQIRLNAQHSEDYLAVASFDCQNNFSGLESGSLVRFVSPPVVKDLPGEVVINEIMWMGSSVAASDEWLELRNMTDQDISLDGWVIEGAGSTAEPDLRLPAQTVLPAHKFFLISNYSTGDENSALLHPPDWVTTTLHLHNSGETLILKNDQGLEIDRTPLAQNDWPEGENTDQKRSMERNPLPGDGSQARNWRTCLSKSCFDARSLYWQQMGSQTGSNFGSPGGATLSSFLSGSEPQLEMTIDQSSSLWLILDHVANYSGLEYQISYLRLDPESDQPILEKIMGSFNLNSDLDQTVLGPIYLGTCSGQDCLSHQLFDVIDIQVLLQPGDPDQDLWQISKTLQI